VRREVTCVEKAFPGTRYLSIDLIDLNYVEVWETVLKG